MRIFLFLIILASLSPSAVRANPEESIILDEIVVRGKEQSAYSSNLTIREVSESSARDIGEALQNVPGLTFVRKGAIANDIVMRGMQRDNINVLLDGVRLYGGCPSRMDPPSFHFDFAEVESIEVIRGPYDLSHPGSLGGMVNAISKSPPSGSDFNFIATAGSNEMFHTSATASYGTKSLDLLGGYAYKYSLPPESGDGKLITDIYPAASNNRYRDDRINSRAYDMQTGWAKSGYKFGNSGRSEVGYSYQDAEHVLYPYLLMDADYDKTHRLNWTTRSGNRNNALENYEVQLWWDQVEHLMSDRNRVSSLPSMMVTRDYGMLTDSETSVYGTRINGSIDAGNGQLKTGFDYYHRNWDATNTSAMFMAYLPQPMIPDVGIENIGGFVEYNWNPYEKWHVEIGMRVDHTAAEATNLNTTRLTTLYQPYHSGSSLSDNTDFTELGGNLQLTWQPQTGMEIFAGFASVARPPDPQELYIGLQRTASMMMPNVVSWIGNPDLNTVRNNQLDLGLKLTTESTFLTASIFYSDFDDYIYLTEEPDPDGAALLTQARTYRNIDARTWGGELSTQTALPQNIFLTGVLSYTQGEDRTLNEPLAEIPPLTGSLFLRYDVDTWFIEAGERFADQQNRVAASLNEQRTAGWGVTDIKAGYHFTHWSLIAGINNLFDKHYFTHLSYQRDPFRSGVLVPESGQTAYLTISCSY